MPVIIVTPFSKIRRKTCICLSFYTSIYFYLRKYFYLNIMSTVKFKLDLKYPFVFFSSGSHSDFLNDLKFIDKKERSPVIKASLRRFHFSFVTHFVKFSKLTLKSENLSWLVETILSTSVSTRTVDGWRGQEWTQFFIKETGKGLGGSTQSLG